MISIAICRVFVYAQSEFGEQLLGPAQSRCISCMAKSMHAFKV